MAKGDTRAHSERRAYGGFSLWGVPYARVDIEYATAQIRKLYFEKFPGPNGPMQALLDYNEKIVSRSGMLMGFSGILIAVSLFIAANPKFLPTLWQRWAFYVVIAIWVIATLRLLWSLRHEMPAPWEFGSQPDVDRTIRLFLRRMGNYNLALAASVICFACIVILLAPVSAAIVDRIFAGP
ncbi:MAG TPA: hypothetical protein VLX44_09875 [Xanthobacteraceae bacterium]|nr:hypothetical protein [Xanthobacteraceae bacterium]